MKKKNSKNGFTLAEVLIALTVIGVIAAITVPALIQKTQKQEYVSALKKAYSTLSQAAQMIIAENGRAKEDENGETWMIDTDSIYNMFKKYLHNSKDCSSSGGCFEQIGNKGYQNLNGEGSTNPWNKSNSNYKALITADGAQVLFAYKSKKCESEDDGSNGVCGRISVDINGAKKPNIIGRDVFYFVLKEDALLPQGCDYGNYCQTNNKGQEGWGKGCACRVLRENAMNY